MDARQMRKDLAEVLGRETVPDSIWDFLKNYDLVERALEYSKVDKDFAIRDLADAACDLMEIGGRGYGHSNRGPRLDKNSHIKKVNSSFIEMSDIEKRYAKVMGIHYTHLELFDLLVHDFRTRILEGALLTPEEAEAFILSPAVAFLSFEEFQKLGIPLIGHEAEYLGPSEEGPRYPYSIKIFVDPPGREYTRYYGNPAANLPSMETMLYKTMSGDCYTIQGLSTSLFGRLRSHCFQLVEEFHFELTEVARCILTGESPTVPAVNAHASYSNSNGFVSRMVKLEIQPWASTETVVREYQLKRNEIRGRAYRPLGEKNLALIEFVRKKEYMAKPEPKYTLENSTEDKVFAEFLDLLGAEEVLQRPSWSALRDEWNSMWPTWQYEDTGRMARDYNRSLHLLTFVENMKFPFIIEFTLPADDSAEQE